MVPMLTIISAAPMMKYWGVSQKTLMGTGSVLVYRFIRRTSPSLTTSTMHATTMDIVEICMATRACLGSGLQRQEHMTKQFLGRIAPAAPSAHGHRICASVQESLCDLYDRASSCKILPGTSALRVSGAMGARHALWKLFSVVMCVVIG